MRYFYAALIAAAVLLAVILVVVLCVQLRRKWAYRKLAGMTSEKKIEELDEALTPFGFRYQCRGDLITSGMYPWQREMGYCRQYDEAAPLMNMIFDAQPVYFDYNGARWLVELWKGQYGCTTGAEVGLYVNRSAERSAGASDLFYECAGDEDRLNMQFRLWKNGVLLMERGGLHWWLTGFRVGEYSLPRELFMEVTLYFTDMMMRNAFYEGALRAGYKQSEIRVDQHSVTLLFDRPKTAQHFSCSALYIRWVSWWNRRYCRLYCKVTGMYHSALDRILYLGYCFPLLFHRMKKLGMRCTPRKLRRYSRRKRR